MFADFSRFSVAVAMCSALASCAGQSDFDASAAPVPALTEAPERSIDSRCDADGNCKAALDDVSRAVEICDGMSPNLYWRNDKPNLLLACECNCTSHDNMGWFIFAGQKEVQGVSLGKPATVESLRGVDKIPDIIASHPLCDSIDPNELGASDFISLIKYPTGNDASPYCFEVRSIREASGDVLVVENSQAFDKNDDDAFFGTDSEKKSEVLELARAASAFQ